MSRRAVAVALAVLVVAGTLPAGLAAAGQGTVLVVTPSASPSQPTTEANFTVTATVTSAETSDGPARLRELELRNGTDDDSELLAAEEVRQGVSPGETVHQRLSVGVDEPGERTLYVHARFRGPNQELFEVVRPLNVTVLAPHPELSLTGGRLAPDGDATFTLTLANGLDGRIGSPVLELSADDAAIRDRRRVAGALDPGATRTFEVSAANATAGAFALDATLSYTTTGGEQREVTRELETDVEPDGERAPALSLAADPVGADDRTTLEVTVANGGERELRGLTLDLTAEEVDVRNGRRIAPALAPGEARTFTVTAAGATSGPLDATATLSYTTADGDDREITRDLSTTVEASGGTVPVMSVSAAPVGASGETTLTVDVANGRESAIRAVALELESGDLNLSERRQVRSKVESGGVTAFAFDTGAATPGEKSLRATLSYTVADGTRREVERDLSVALDAVENPGRVRLTGLRVSRTGDGLSVRGSASNVGATNVSSVVVGVAEGEEVGPAQSQSTFFVGDVPASDFASFEVSAVAEANGTVTVPLEISYVVDGVRTERVVEVDYRPPATPETRPRRSGFGLTGLAPVVGAVILVGAVVAVWYRRR